MSGAKTSKTSVVWYLWATMSLHKESFKTNNARVFLPSNTYIIRLSYLNSSNFSIWIIFHVLFAGIESMVKSSVSTGLLTFSDQFEMCTNNVKIYIFLQQEPSTNTFYSHSVVFLPVSKSGKKFMVHCNSEPETRPAMDRAMTRIFSFLNELPFPLAVLAKPIQKEPANFCLSARLIYEVKVLLWRPLCLLTCDTHRSLKRRERYHI